VDQVPTPSMGPDEALLKVIAAGVCGTDVRIFQGAHRKYPPGTVRVPGHEVVGEVADVGPDVEGVRVGQRMFVAPNIGCGHCRQCVSGRNNRCAAYDALGVTLDGAFAEFMRIPAAAIRQGNLIPVASGVEPAAAALVEPLACVLNGQTAVSVKPGDVVLIMGAGPIGVMHALLARLTGAGRVVVSDFLADRLTFAKRMGADRVVNLREEDLPAVLAEESRGEGADVIIVAAPSRAAQEEALRLAAIGGRINFFGGLPKGDSIISFDSNLVHYKELCVTGTSACSSDDCWRAAAIVNSGRIDLSSLVSAVLPLRKILDAFLMAEDKSSIKIVVEP
jgi:L-iditol 2-dehydrogenase